jgi:hypothetical protein
MSTCAMHADQTAAAYCRTCGRALCEQCKREVRGVVYCEDCIAARVQDTMPAAAPGRVYMPAVRRGPNPVAAALLGIIPGVGAMYNGQFAKALVQVVIFAALIWMANRADILGLLVAFWYFYMIFDAYKTARAMELGLPLPDPLGLNRMIGIDEGLTVPVSEAPAPGPVNDPAAAGVPPSAGPVAPQPAAADTRRSGPPVGAILLIAIGVLFLLDNLGLFHFHWVSRFWPVVLIAVGLWLFLRRTALPPEPR